MWFALHLLLTGCCRSPEIRVPRSGFAAVTFTRELPDVATDECAARGTLTGFPDPLVPGCYAWTGQATRWFTCPMWDRECWFLFLGDGTRTRFRCGDDDCGFEVELTEEGPFDGLVADGWSPPEEVEPIREAMRRATRALVKPFDQPDATAVAIRPEVLGTLSGCLDGTLLDHEMPTSAVEWSVRAQTDGWPGRVLTLFLGGHSVEVGGHRHALSADPACVAATGAFLRSVYEEGSEEAISR